MLTYVSIRSPSEFWDRRGKYGLVEKEAATIRYQHFEQLRLAKLDAVRRERDAMAAEYEGGLPSTLRHSPGKGNRSPTMAKLRAKSAGAVSNSSALSGDPQGSSSPTDLVGGGDSTMVMLEERRLQKMKIRQQKEIQGVIEMETKMAKIQLENSRRAAEDVRKKLEFQKELRAKRAQLVAAKHERELAKKKQDDLEAHQRRQRAKQEAEKEKKLLEDEDRKAQERKREAMLREVERSEKAEEFRRQTEALLKQQEDLVTQNRARMLEKEKQVMYKMEAASRRRHLAALERRDRANLRIHQASVQNQLNLQKRKEDFDLKQSTAAERAREIQAKTIKDLKDRAAFQKKEEEIRQKRLEAARKHHEDGVARILTKRSAMEHKLEEVYRERERERLLTIVEKELSHEEKVKTVERLKRVEEYNRMLMIQKISEEDARSRSIKEKKKQIMEARQKIALDSLLRKHKIHQAMEQLRQSNKWDKIEETLYAI
jgi:hypothetical protein